MCTYSSLVFEYNMLYPYKIEIHKQRNFILASLKIIGEKTQKLYFYENLCTSKGQLISKCPFGVKTSSKKPTKFFHDFCP